MNATICGAWVVLTYWKGRDAVGWQGKKVYSAFTVPPLPPQILSSPALSSDGSLGLLALAVNHKNQPSFHWGHGCGGPHAHFGPKAGFSRELFFRSCEATFGAAHGGMESALLPGHCLGWPWHSSFWLWRCMVSRQSNKVVQKGTGSSCARWTAYRGTGCPTAPSRSGATHDGMEPPIPPVARAGLIVALPQNYSGSVAAHCGGDAFGTIQ